jgi:hypothetical protein
MSASVYQRLVAATAMLKCAQAGLASSEAAIEDEKAAGAALILSDCIERFEDLQQEIYELEAKREVATTDG